MRNTPSSPTENRKESGQAIVLIALIMVALIAVTGLAIDGGGIIFLYRDARNATDAAVLAAAYARCTDGDVVQAGQDAAFLNGFDNDGTQDRVIIQNPPLAGAGAGNDAFVSVSIEAVKPSYFIQIVYPEALRISTFATGYCREAFDPSTVPGIMAVGDMDCPNGTMNISGASQTIVGDTHSNASTKQSGGGQGITIEGNSSSVTTFDPPNFSSKVTYPDPPGGTYTPGVEPKPDPFQNVNLDMYRPGGVIWNAIDPNFRRHIVGDLTINRPTAADLYGLIMVEGDVTLRQGVADPNVGVTIVASGSIKWTSPDGTITYYKDILTLNDNGIPSIGFLFYTTAGNRAPSCAASNARIEFSSNSVNATGVLYAPNAGIDASYSSGFYRGALIGWFVSLSGSDSTIIRDPTLFPAQPPIVSITE